MLIVITANTFEQSVCLNQTNAVRASVRCVCCQFHTSVQIIFKGSNLIIDTQRENTDRVFLWPEKTRWWLFSFVFERTRPAPRKKRIGLAGRACECGVPPRFQPVLYCPFGLARSLVAKHHGTYILACHRHDLLVR